MIDAKLKHMLKGSDLGTLRSKKQNFDTGGTEVLRIHIFYSIYMIYFITRSIQYDISLLFNSQFNTKFNLLYR